MESSVMLVLVIGWILGSFTALNEGRIFGKFFLLMVGLIESFLGMLTLVIKSEKFIILGVFDGEKRGRGGKTSFFISFPFMLKRLSFTTLRT